METGKLIAFPRRHEAAMINAMSPALICTLVPEEDRSLHQEIIDKKNNPQFKSRAQKIVELKRICRHLFHVEWEKVRSGKIVSYTKICIICGFHEIGAKVEVKKKGRKVATWAFKHFHGSHRFFTSRHAGNWTLGIFYDPLERIFKDILDEVERRKQIGQRLRSGIWGAK